MKLDQSPVVIKVDNLGHIYRSFEKGESFKDMMKDFFSRDHRDVTSLEDVSFQVHRGEILGLLGANGAGKTTLLKILSGLISPSRGQVSVLGIDPYERKAAYLRRIGFVFGQKSQLNWDLPSYDTFDLLKAVYGIPQKLFDERLSKFTSLLNFSHKLRTPVRKLSLGERMKAELICSLLHMPEILFLDEPTIGLDIVSQKVIRNFVRSIVNDNGVTVILTSHYMSDIEELADRLCILQRGKVSYDGYPQGLLANCTSEVEIRFVPKEITHSEKLVDLGFEQGERQEWKGRFVSECVNLKLHELLKTTEVESLQVSSQSLEERIYEMFSADLSPETI